MDLLARLHLDLVVDLCKSTSIGHCKCFSEDQHQIQKQHEEAVIDHLKDHFELAFERLHIEESHHVQLLPKDNALELENAALLEHDKEE